MTSEQSPKTIEDLRLGVVGVIKKRRKDEAKKGNSIEKRFERLGLATRKVSHTYEGVEVKATEVILKNGNTNGGLPAFMFWKGRHLGQTVSVFWVEKSIKEFSYDQLRAALDFATLSDMKVPPDLNDRKIKGGIPHHIIEIIDSYYPYYP